MRQKQKGFSTLLVLVVLLVAGAAGFYTLKQGLLQKKEGPIQSSSFNLKSNPQSRDDFLYKRLVTDKDEMGNFITKEVVINRDFYDKEGRYYNDLCTITGIPKYPVLRSRKEIGLCGGAIDQDRQNLAKFLPDFTREVGESCSKTKDCAMWYQCVDGICSEGKEENKCYTTSDCSTGLLCIDNECSSGSLGSRCDIDSDCNERSCNNCYCEQNICKYRNTPSSGTADKPVGVGSGFAR